MSVDVGTDLPLFGNEEEGPEYLPELLETLEWLEKVGGVGILLAADPTEHALLVAMIRECVKRGNFETAAAKARSLPFADGNAPPADPPLAFKELGLPGLYPVVVRVAKGFIFVHRCLGTLQSEHAA